MLRRTRLHLALIAVVVAVVMAFAAHAPAFAEGATTITILRQRRPREVRSVHAH